MENKSIWDLISSIGLMQNKNKTSQEENATESYSSAQENNASKQENTPRDKSLPYGSFAKTYNPFSERQTNKSQVISKKAERPARTTIDLKNSKNVAKEKDGGSQNIIDLINRHNYYSKKIRDKK